MRTSKSLSYALATAFGVATLVGCSNYSQMTPTSATPAGMTQSAQAQVLQYGRLDRILALNRGVTSAHPVTTRSFFSSDAKGKRLIFAANDLGSCGDGYVDIYLQGRKNKMVGQVTGLCVPAGLATDAARNLYVADEGHSAVPVYAPPYTGAPSLTLDDTGEFPYDVAVSRKGVVAVLNICSAPSCGGSGNVTFYGKNSTTPCATVSDPNFNMNADSFDQKENLYIDGEGGPPSYSSVLGEIKGGCQAKKIISLVTTNTIGSLGSIKVDKAGRIAVADYYSSSDKVIETYNPPHKRSLGSPVSTISLSGLLRAYRFTFRGSGAEIYVGAANNSGYEVVNFGYPGGAEKKAFNAGGGTGIAVTPPLIP